MSVNTHYQRLMAELLLMFSQNEACVERAKELLTGRWAQQPPEPRWGTFMMYVYYGDYESAITTADPLNFYAFTHEVAQPKPDKEFMACLQKHYLSHRYPELSKDD